VSHAAELNPEDIVCALQSDEARKVFQENGVLAAYLFGSVVKEDAHARSDVDVAVVFHHSVPRPKYFDRRIAISQVLGRLLHTNDVDVVPLNHAPLLLAFEALKHPVTLYVADETEAAEFELRTLGMYYDFVRIVDSYIDEMRLRIKERKLA